jgi:hypothetical protein
MNITSEEVEQPVFQDLYLKADSEDALMDALIDAGIYLDQDEVTETDEDGNIVIVQPAAEGLVSGVSLDIIGVIYKQTGETVLEDGTIMPEMSMIDGYHANLRGSFTEEQKSKLPLIEAPSTPTRIWA